MADNLSEMDAFIDSPGEIATIVGERVLALRLSQNRSREDVAKAAGIGVMTLRRFELSGRANFEAVVRIAIALGDDRALGQLFRPRDFRTLDEVIDVQARRVRRRASRRVSKTTSRRSTK
jgi:transcriptional regulator with XRE-family HTH domain